MGTSASLRSVVACCVFSACVSEGSIVPWESSGALPIHDIKASGPLDLEAQVTWADRDTLLVVVEMANPGQDTVQVDTGVCNLRVRAYPSDDFVEPAIWDDHWVPNLACVDLGLRYYVPPGEVTDLERRISESGTALWPPPRRAYFRVVLVLNGDLRLLDTGLVSR